MATNFPSSLDAFTNPTSADTLDNPPHDQQHADINDAMEAVQTALLDGAPLHIDDANERVGIGDTTPSYKLDVDGDINTTGVFRVAGTEIIGLQLISSTTLSGATTTFSSIPATFKSLRVVLDDVIVSDASVGINATFNNDTAANYTQVVTRAEDGDSGTSRQLVGYGNQTSHFVTFNNIRGAAGSGGGDRQNQFLIDLPNYSQGVAYKNVVVRSIYLAAFSGTYHATVIDGSWKNVAAISEIDINVSAGTFTSGTAYLYGY